MVVPTPSAKPTCEHGKLSGHYWITDADITSFGSWCPGPVIAGEDYHDGPFLCLTCGRHLPCRHCNDVTVSTEPETPVFDPSPELRERLAIAMFERDGPSHIIDWEFYANKDRYLCLADAVLVVLGEPK